MMMNLLECQVTACAHNCQNLCSLPKIKVDGPSARESSQTCCLSYDSKNSAAQNSASYEQNASPETGISCEAKNCEYNENCKCHADNVCVGCCCGDVSSKSGTECCTFVMK